MRLWLPTLGLAATASLVSAGPVLDLDHARVVDLTYAFGSDTLYWPTSPSGFELKRLHYGKTDGGYFYAANSFCAPEHGGTHMDAPVHFAEGSQSLDQVPVERLVAPAFVIDASATAAADRDYRLTAADVLAFEKRNGRIPAGAIVLLRTGWGKRWGNRKAYFGDDTPGDASRLHFPGYGKDAAQLLVERRVAAIGVDTPSVDYGPSQDYAVHQVVAPANIPNLENVANLEQLPETGAFVLALPMKIAGGSGGPLRLVALVPK
jgi:kynurenine formamidase